MTIETFRSNIKRYRRFEAVQALLFLVLILLSILPNRFLVHQADQQGLDPASIAVVALSYTLIAMLMLYVAMPMRQRTLRKWGLQCPGCGRDLFGEASTEVMATGYCSCGRPILHRE